MVVMRRWREWILLPVAYFAMLFVPLFWLYGLPNTIRFAILTRHLSRDVDLALDGLAGTRWFTRSLHTMASGEEDDSFFELMFANGTRVVVHDTYDRTLEKRLAARAQLPPHPTRLGGELGGLVWMCWLSSTAITAVVIAFLYLVCCRRG